MTSRIMLAFKWLARSCQCPGRITRGKLKLDLVASLNQSETFVIGGIPILTQQIDLKPHPSMSSPFGDFSGHIISYVRRHRFDCETVSGPGPCG